MNTMRKVLAVLIAGTFTFASESVLAQASVTPKPETQSLKGLAVPLKQMDVEQANTAHQTTKGQ